MSSTDRSTTSSSTLPRPGTWQPPRVQSVVEIGAQSLKFHRLRGNAVETRKESYSLGREVYTSGSISEGTAVAVARSIVDSGARQAIAIGTSPLRDARNRADFAALLRELACIDVLVLSPKEEAWLLAQGFQSRRSERPALVVDMGGGSLQLVYILKRGAVLWDSLPLGAIRVHEIGRRQGPAARDRWIEASLGNAVVLSATDLFVTGGTARAIAGVLEREEFTREDLQDLEDRIAACGPPSELKKERAEVFGAGVRVLQRFLETVGADAARYLGISIGGAVLEMAGGRTRHAG